MRDKTKTVNVHDATYNLLRKLALLWQIYLRRFALQIHFLQ